MSMGQPSLSPSRRVRPGQEVRFFEKEQHMKGTPIFSRNTFLKVFAAAVLSISAIGQVPASAATETARVVKYSQNDIVTVHAKLRYSTLIVLPENEEILDFTTGDKDF